MDGVNVKDNEPNLENFLHSIIDDIVETVFSYEKPPPTFEDIFKDF